MCDSGACSIYSLHILSILFLSLCICSFLAKRGVKDEICSFDARKITPDIRASVEELLEKNANSFDPKVIRKVYDSSETGLITVNVKTKLPLKKNMKLHHHWLNHFTVELFVLLFSLWTQD